MSTFWRLLGFLRPYRRAAIWSFGLAFGALIGTVLIPYLTGVAINAVRAHNHHRLVLLALAIVAAAPARRRPGLVRGRGRPAQRAVGAAAATRAGVLRPPADRAADVPGDGRPAV